MIPLPLLLTATIVRVSVFGEGRLCFESGSGVTFAPSATLKAGAKGLLTDATGRPVFPHVAVPAPTFAVSMSGTVSVSGRPVGRLMLQKTDGRPGYPGDAGFGVLQVGGKEEGDKGTKTSSHSPLPSSSPLLIKIHPRTEIDGERVLLRDIADLSGEPARKAELGEVDLGATPTLGARRSLSSWTLIAALRDAGFEKDAYTLRLPPDVTVARKGQTVDPKTILEAALAEAKRLSGGVEPTPIRGATVTSVLAPLGDLKIETTNARNGDRIEIEVAVRVDGLTVSTQSLAFRVHLDGVKAGDALRVFVACGGAAVETDAKAKSGGVVGDAIQIVTADGTLLTATVTGTGKAEVKL